LLQPVHLAAARRCCEWQIAQVHVTDGTVAMRLLVSRRSRGVDVFQRATYAFLQLLYKHVCSTVAA
jgi:hypothetical protein